MQQLTLGGEDHRATEIASPRLLTALAFQNRHCRYQPPIGEGKLQPKYSPEFYHLNARNTRRNPHHNILAVNRQHRSSQMNNNLGCEGLFLCPLSSETRRPRQATGSDWLPCMTMSVIQLRLVLSYSAAPFYEYHSYLLK